MIAMILAAGRGQRLAPITDVCPKPLVPVLGKPLIVYQIERLKAAGFKEFVINLHYLGEQIEDTLADGSELGVKISYSKEKEPLDVAGGVSNALHLLGDNPFLLVSSDIYTDFPYESLLGLNPKVAHMVMVPNPEYHPNGDFDIKNGKLAEKSDKNSMTYANIGVFQPQFFATLPNKVYPLSGLLYPAVKANLISAQIFEGSWANVGTLKELHELEQDLVLDAKVKNAS
jgi:MurNAc alpha-1-phosphate uridylyltransferase